MSRESWLERVREEERKIIAAEGMSHAGGRYSRDEHSANLERRWLAEVRASRAIARDALRRNGCSWCGRVITPEQASVAAAGAEIHADPCAKQFAEFTGEAVSAVERWAAA